jgi:hypothetical protein
MSRSYARIALIALPIAVAIGAADLISSTTYAQPYNPGYNPGYYPGYTPGSRVRRDRDRDRDEHSTRKDCKPEYIQATGSSRWGDGGALSSAKNYWRRDVVSRFGKEYAEWQFANAAQPRCYDSDISIAGHHFRQCTISAAPCRVQPGQM